jgi:protein-L-isoaspartate(D-aspartate) O-methyltransferase
MTDKEPPMPNFKAARTNMVDCQIHTSGVVSASILTAFSTIPREKFVPANMQSVAYGDSEVSLGSGRYLIGPMTHARMIEAAAPALNDTVLDVGGATGYSAAILSSMVKDVVALDEKADFLKKAEDLWNSLGISNVRSVAGKLVEGAPAHGPFDLIFINGAVDHIPETFINQLSAKGRLITIKRAPGAGVGQVILAQKVGTALSARPLFEAGGPYLPGFEPKTAFNF